MENAMMTDKLLKRDVLFNCADTIESLICSQCANFKTHNLVHLNYHFKAGHTLPESNEKLYQCESCDFLTHSKFLSLTHQLLNLCTRSKKVKSNKTASKSISSTHRKSGKNKLSKCKHCPYTTKTPRNLKTHILFKHTHPDKISWFQCAQCPLKFKTKYCLNNHMDVHGNRKFLKCDQCPFATKHLKSLKRHISSKHTALEEIEWFECARCSFKSIHKSGLKQHMDRVHAHKTLLKCDRCPFETKHEGFLKHHILSTHTDPAKIRWFKCAQCWFKSKTKSYLSKHMRVQHGNKKTLRCGQCSLETKDRRTLRNHVLSKHTTIGNIKRFECAQCSFKSMHKYGLKHHMDRSHGDKILLKCDHCLFETKHAGFLKHHVLSKHTDPAKIKWFKCAQCSFKSAKEDSLLKHMSSSSHGSKAKLKCDECPFETTSPKSLALHLLSKYPDPDEFKWFCCEHCSYRSKIKKKLLQHKKDVHHRAKIP